MNWFHALTRPYYLYRPTQIGRRLRHAWKQSSPYSAEVTMPWEYPLRISSGDELGKTLLTAGINDLTVTESIYRLLGPGETAVDVGANAGYMTGLMAARAQTGGKVWAFEPHPTLFRELTCHVASWRACGLLKADVQLLNAAVSDHHGTATLVEPADFQHNRGLSHIQVDAAPLPSIGGTREYQTDLVTLDEMLDGAGEIEVLKVDVEGHEEAVFRGMKSLLSNRRVRHVIYEEFHSYPAPAHRILEQHGYETFVVEEKWLGPRLVAAGGSARRPSYAPPNYLATRDPAELRQRFAAHGWKCLRPYA